jgi:hypothetical protein
MITNHATAHAITVRTKYEYDTYNFSNTGRAFNPTLFTFGFLYSTKYCVLGLPSTVPRAIPL